jgi:xyloglucan-specific endo-beta-1,4-glucanase
MKLQQTLLLLPLATSALAAPSPTLEKRATTICGQWDSVVTGTYTVYQDLWGEFAATSGSQCTTVNSDNDGTLSWAGGSSSVKSYANAVVTATVQQISAINSIPTTWDWRQVQISTTE